MSHTLSTTRGVILRALPTSVILAARTTRGALKHGGGVDLAQVFGTGHSRGVTIRPVCSADEGDWRQAMAANHERMTRWWSVMTDVEAASGRVAFAEHVRAWNQRLKRGHGVCLAMVDDDGLIGELHLWHLRPGGLTCEIGAWLSPKRNDATRGVGGCMAYAVDALFGMGVRRIDAPVAAGNPMPRRLLSLAGFELDASIQAWREHQGDLIDYDLFGLTPQRWERARPMAWRIAGSWERVTP